VRSRGRGSASGEKLPVPPVSASSSKKRPARRGLLEIEMMEVLSSGGRTENMGRNHCHYGRTA